MTLATLDRIVRRFGDLEVLDGASLQIDEGDRVGVVGDNGSGKTTLIRILAGIDEPDGGMRSLRRGLRLAYAEQIPRLVPGTTVREFVERGDGTFDALAAQIGAVEKQLVDSPHDERLLARYGELQGAFEAAGGYDHVHHCERVLSGLGFDDTDLDKDVDILSGGERSRVVLASLMTAPADLLILDEPTNHLDLEGIAFVEDCVQRYPGAVVTISHDRRFLDAAARRIVEIQDGGTSNWKGNWSAWREQRDKQLLTDMRAFKNQQAFIDKEMDYVRRNMGSRMTRQAKGRLKKLSRLERITKPKGERRGMSLRFAEQVRGRSGQTMIEAIEVTLRVGGRVLLDRDSLRIEHGDVVGLVGRNGCGKTTLMNALSGRRGVDGGRVERAYGLQIGAFSQEVTDLPRGITVIEALRQLDATVPERELRDHLARFEFTGDDVEAKIDDLSGGEKQRLSLARMTRTPYDLLCLDEPTNHLDITGREGLQEALSDFPGAVLLITHDRELLSALCTRIVYLEDGRLRSFDGGLEECMTTIARERAARRSAAMASAMASKHATRRDAAPASTGRSAPSTEARNDRIRNPMMFERLETEIMTLEEELTGLRSAMTEESNYRDADRLRKLQDRERELQARLAAAYQRWENWN